MSASVVVAVDKSEQSMSAVDWAAAEAWRHQRQLVIVHVLMFPMVDLPEISAEYGRQMAGDLRAEALTLVAAAEKRARDIAPDLKIRSEIHDGYSAAATLSRRSRNAALMVLGRRGSGRFAELLVGSTAAQVTAHAVCPVVVIRDSHRPDATYPGQVIAAVDGSPSSQPVLEFAFSEAAAHDTGLVAIHVWEDPWSSSFAVVPPTEDELSEDLDEARRMLSEALAGWRQKFPEVAVTTATPRGAINRTLSDLSVGARLLVVGSHGHGQFAGMLLGSTSQAMLHYAQAPVAVVRLPRQ
ncbi:MAG TPA: universal stress protein [Stackebrandtia sp.]|jgi:nucleotide-binding universal stress UspA family protein|uniref:universal stress protein n=1 Tax=Stackebrandtia sp. TaxID=2023065 RepID=UPI002D49C507|nr:universal stress protein [Stackebrandtia sp.]HZE38331.1 universal stress protein [Stackebrandtia sp.]